MSYWDTTACFKALCAAYSDFQKQPNEQTVQDLQRQIDVSITYYLRITHLIMT